MAAGLGESGGAGGRSRPSKGASAPGEGEIVRCPDEIEMAAWLDQAMDGGERAHWREHFMRCAKCRKALEELSQLMLTAPLDPGNGCLGRCKALVAGAGAAGGWPLVSERTSPGGAPVRCN